MKKTVHGWALIPLALLLGASDAYGGAKDFDSFFVQFKTAVEQRDEKVLTTLMSPSFAFIRAEIVPPAEVFRGLDADAGRQWQNLQHAVLGQPTAYSGGRTIAAPAKVLRCTPTEQIYNCLVIFTRDRRLGWRWKGMVMPTR
jgi:hypothetical protein